MGTITGAARLRADDARPRAPIGAGRDLPSGVANAGGVARLELPMPEIPVVWLKPLDEAGRRLRMGACPRRAARLRLAASVGIGLMLGGGLSETAVAPAASAHDRGGSGRGDAVPALDALAGILPGTPARAPLAAAAPTTDGPAAPPALVSVSPSLPAPEADARFELAAVAANWDGAVALPAQEPTTAELVESELRGLVAAARREDAERSAVGGSPDDPAKGAAPARDPDELLRFGGTAVRRWIVETILRASAATGVDPVYMMALADKESSFSTAVRASTSSAEGLFQFITKTWLEVVREFGPRHGLAEEAALIEVKDGAYVIADDAARDRVLALRRNPYVAALMAAELLKRDRVLVESRIGRDLKLSELYFAHFFGAESAGRFMAIHAEKPKQVAGRIFGAAAKANRSLFFARKGRRLRGLTVAEVYGRIDKMIDTRLGRYAQVAAAVAAPAATAEVAGPLRPTLEASVAP